MTLVAKNSMVDMFLCRWRAVKEVAVDRDAGTNTVRRRKLETKNRQVSATVFKAGVNMYLLIQDTSQTNEYQ